MMVVAILGGLLVVGCCGAVVLGLDGAWSVRSARADVTTLLLPSADPQVTKDELNRTWSCSRLHQDGTTKPVEPGSEEPETLPPVRKLVWAKKPRIVRQRHGDDCNCHPGGILLLVLLRRYRGGARGPFYARSAAQKPQRKRWTCKQAWQNFEKASAWRRRARKSKSPSFPHCSAHGDCSCTNASSGRRQEGVTFEAGITGRRLLLDQIADLLELRRAGHVAPFEQGRFDGRDGRSAEFIAAGLSQSSRRERRRHLRLNAKSRGQQVMHRLLHADAFNAANQDGESPLPQFFEQPAAFTATKGQLGGFSSFVASSGEVGPSPLGYCSVASTGSRRIFAPSISRPMFQTSSSCPGMSCTSLPCTSTTSSAVSPRFMSSGLRGRRGMKKV